MIWGNSPKEIFNIFVTRGFKPTYFRFHPGSDMRRLALLPFALLAACVAHGGDQVDAPAAAGRTDTLARIHALVGTPSCTEDSQCRTLAIGEKSCGGPERYLAYSTVASSEAELKALGDIYRAERRAANTRSGQVSTCSVVGDPGAVCRAGACELRPGQPVAR
jgi:hypothetical protein